MTEEIKNKLSLNDFVKLISTWFREIFGDTWYWVFAEISKIKQRHDRVYIELLEYKEDTVVAKAHAVIMDMKIVRDLLEGIWYKKIDELNKIQILFFATPLFHKDYGFQLHISKISTEYSIWNIKKKESNIREQLHKLGIFESNKKLKIWNPPYHIGIISSETSEWLKDFLWVMDDSWYNYRYKLYPSAIHGNQANTEVHNTLQKVFREIKDGKENIDILIILRWWGWSSGIMRHNDIGIAKGICYMPIPVIIAIWHKQDRYLLDDICYHSAISPSDAWHRIVDRYNQFSDHLHIFIDHINKAVAHKIISYKSDLNTIYQEINYLVISRFENYKNTIKSNYDIISSNDPARLQSLGYGILQDIDGNIIRKDKISWLSKWENLDIKIYDHTITVKIEEIK